MSVTVRQKVDFSVNELSSPQQVAFYEYWLSIKGDKDLPLRDDFNPMKIPKTLPYIIMEEVFMDPVRFKIRLIGSKCKAPGSYLGKFTNDIAEMKDITKMLEKALEFKSLIFILIQLSIRLACLNYILLWCFLFQRTVRMLIFSWPVTVKYSEQAQSKNFSLKYLS